MPLRALTVVLMFLVGGALLWILIAGTDDGGLAERITSPREKRAVRLQERLVEDPRDEKLLLATMQAWLGAGGQQIERIDPQSQPIPAAVSEDYEAGLRAWTRYLAQGGKPSAYAAERASDTYFSLVEIGSPSPGDAKANARGAVIAQKIVCDEEATLYTLSNLAVYSYFNGEFSAGDKAARAAAADIAGAGGIQPRTVIGQLNEYKERAEKFVARIKRGERELSESGEEELEAPIKGYGSHAGINGYEPGTEPGPS